MTILIDTSVWVHHFREVNTSLVQLLLADQVLSHPMVALELASGTPPAPRQKTLADLNQLRSCNPASIDEVRSSIKENKRYGLGCGVSDLMLLASVMPTPGSFLWTQGRKLESLAQRFGVAWRPIVH